MVFKELSEFINSIKNYENRIYFATNSINLGYYPVENKKADYYFWVDPPWRISQYSKIIINSYNYPYHDNFEFQEDENNAFKLWTSKIDFMRNYKIRSVEFNKIGDLSILWENDCLFESFVNNTDSASYHFYDYVNLIDYEIFPGEIRMEKMKVREKL